MKDSIPQELVKLTPICQNVSVPLPLTERCVATCGTCQLIKAHAPEVSQVPVIQFKAHAGIISLLIPPTLNALPIATHPSYNAATLTALSDLPSQSLTLLSLCPPCYCYSSLPASLTPAMSSLLATCSTSFSLCF